MRRIESEREGGREGERKERESKKGETKKEKKERKKKKKNISLVSIGQSGASFAIAAQIGGGHARALCGNTCGAAGAQHCCGLAQRRACAEKTGASAAMCAFLLHKRRFSVFPAGAGPLLRRTSLMMALTSSTTNAACGARGAGRRA